MATQDFDACITVKAYQRPIHLYRCLRSLMKSIEVLDKNCSLIVSIDRHNDEMVRYQMLSAIELISEEFPRQYIEFNIQEHNLGCLKNTEFCLKESFERKEYSVHIEEDQVLEPDCLRYFDETKSLLEKDDVFSLCSYHSPCHQDFTNDEDDIGAIMAKKWFQGSGPFMINKKTWDRIRKMGGMFGINGMPSHCFHPDHNGEVWKKDAYKSNRGTWDWPFHKYFGAGMWNIYPRISRAQNIGSFGMHNHGPDNTFLEVQHNTDLISNYATEEIEDIYFDIENVIYDDRKLLWQGVLSV